MIARLRSTWFGIKASYWFYPALFAIAGLILALVTVHVDRSGMAASLSRIEAIQPPEPAGARNMLTVLASSMIGIASTVFAITIAAVVYASGSYGPRLLTNFMEDKGNQLSLATFLGTFVYALTVLRSVRASSEGLPLAEAADVTIQAGFVPQLSLLVGFGLMLISVGVLVYFLHHIPSSIRINVVLEGVGRRLLDLAAKRFPEPYAGPPIKRERPSGCHIFAGGAGYIRLIALDQLEEIAEKSSLRMALSVRAGDFVHPGLSLVQIDRPAADEAVATSIRNCFALGASRTPEQDIEFSIDELVEIALRALSPGVNDPFTAITAIHWLGAATASLAGRDLRQRINGKDSDACQVLPLDDDFSHFVKRGFGAMRSAVAANRLAGLVALDAMRDAGSAQCDESRRALLAREGRLLMAQAGHCLRGPDLDEMRARYADFAGAIADAS